MQEKCSRNVTAFLDGRRSLRCTVCTTTVGSRRYKHTDRAVSVSGSLLIRMNDDDDDDPLFPD